MGRKETIPIDRKIRTLEKDTRILKRLYFVKYRYSGDSVKAADDKVGVYKMVGYQWQDRWNRYGYEGLVPRFAGGKPSKLSADQLQILRTRLEERDNWTTEHVQDMIEKAFDIRFSLKHVRTILRKLGMKYSKPYQMGYRRPHNAEERLKKT